MNGERIHNGTFTILKCNTSCKVGIHLDEAAFMQNNFGKYLKFAEANEEIIMTRNGRDVAQLTAYTVTDELVLRAGAVKYSADKNDRVTYEEFLELTKASEQRYELIDGVVTQDLAIEVLSPSSRSKDMIPKLDLYRQCGVKEYWIVDPMKAQVTVYSFLDGEIADVSYYAQGRDPFAESPLYPGLQVSTQDLFV